MPYKSTTPTARIEHECTGCGCTIEPGQRYFRTDGVWTIERDGYDSDELWEDKLGGPPDADSFVKSRTDKLCGGCVFDTDVEHHWCIGDVMSWARQHGGTVTDRDYSYKVSRCITVPEHNWYFTVDGDTFTWGYSAGMQDRLDDLLLWLSSRPSMPDISDTVFEHLVEDAERERTRLRFAAYLEQSKQAASSRENR